MLLFFSQTREPTIPGTALLVRDPGQTQFMIGRPPTNRMMGDVVPVRFFGPFAYNSEKPVDFFVGFDVGQKNASELAAINLTTGILIAGGRWTAGPMTWWNNSTEPFLEFRHQVTQTCPASDQRVLLSIIEITQAEERLVLNTARNTVLWLYYLGLFQEQSVFGDLLILPTGEMHRQILKRFVDLRAWMISAGAGMRRILGLGHFSLFAPRLCRWIHRKKKQTTTVCRTERPESCTQGIEFCQFLIYPPALSSSDFCKMDFQLRCNGQGSSHMLPVLRFRLTTSMARKETPQ